VSKVEDEREIKFPIKCDKKSIKLDKKNVNFRNFLRKIFIMIKQDKTYVGLYPGSIWPVCARSKHMKMGPKLPGRPPAPIHKLYSRVEGSKPNDPKFSCNGRGEEVRGKELVKLCMQSYHCKGLTEDENKFAGTCVEAMEKQKHLLTI
jgi:hypothetical protein